jgi:hypothetical protein
MPCHACCAARRSGPHGFIAVTACRRECIADREQRLVRAAVQVNLIYHTMGSGERYEGASHLEIYDGREHFTSE